MIEILLVLGLLVGLAKRKPVKRRFSLRPVRITPELALGTLASDTAITAALTGNSTVPYRVISIESTWNMIGGTGVDGPVTLGYAHSDYTVTEIKEALEAGASIDPGNKIANEQSNRLIRIVGSVDAAQNRLNDGRPIKTRLNWAISIGQAVNMFAFNEEAAALSTGAVVHLAGKMWIKDSV